MTREQERSAEAYTVWKKHGERAPRFVADRVGLLAMADDLAGVRRWQEIAEALDTIMRGIPSKDERTLNGGLRRLEERRSEYGI